MKRRIIPCLLAGVLAFSLMLGACSAKPETQKKEAAVRVEDEEVVTMEKAADYLICAAAGYNRNLPSKDELTDNFLGLTGKDHAARIQVLVMVSKAFGELPKPVGNSARLAPSDVDLSGVPEWGLEEIKKLKEAGVLVQSDLGNTSNSAEGGSAAGMPESDTSGSEKSESETQTDAAQTDGAVSETDQVKDEVQKSDDKKGEASAAEAKPGGTVTGKELKTMVRRIYALYGTDLKDDFYTAVNKKDLDTKKIPGGETDAGGTYDQRILVQKQVSTIIKEIVEGDGYAPGSMEQKIKDFYKSAADFKTRNALGAEPLRKYLEAIDKAKSVKQLSDAQILSLREIGSGSLINIMYMTDTRDTQKTIPTLLPAVEPEEGQTDASLEKLNKKLLVLSGESEAEAKAHVKAYQKLKQAVKEYDPGVEDKTDAGADVRYVKLEELQKLFPGFDIKALLEAGGNDSSGEFCLMTPAMFEGFVCLLQDEQYLPAVNTALKLNLITSNYTNLSRDFLDAFEVYDQETIGETPSENTDAEIASAMVQNSLGAYIDRLYAKRYFSAEAKKTVEDMVQQFVRVYKARIEKLDWMSDATKKAAVDKLDNMKFFIGYPDRWDDTLDSLEITDSFFDNQVAVSKLNEQRNRKEAAARNRGELENYMKIPVADVNAYYDQYSNTMCFPAGILQAPAFDVNASFEENLGGIGATIAHEITHAFDNTGAKFDAQGLQNDWWGEKDYKEFQALCKKAAAFYDGWESAPGVPVNGTQTLGENIADIGGMACVLEVLKSTENPDYDAFFRAYTRGWLKCTTRARAESLAEIDEHSPSNLRVNRVLSNFQEFYDTYNIKEGDGMYVAPEERISIW